MMKMLIWLPFILVFAGLSCSEEPKRHTLAEIEDSFLQADAAGDTEAAQILADEIRRLRTQRAGTEQGGELLDPSEINRVQPALINADAAGDTEAATILAKESRTATNPEYDIYSKKTGRKYTVEFEREPSGEDVDYAITQLDAQHGLSTGPKHRTANLEEIGIALKNADRAGDVAAATQLAKYYREVQQQRTNTQTRTDQLGRTAWTVPITIDGLTYPVRFDSENEPSQQDIADAANFIIAQNVHLSPGQDRLALEVSGIFLAWLCLVLGVWKFLRKRWRDLGPLQIDEQRGGESGMGGWLKFFAVTTTCFAPLHILGRALTFGTIVGEARKFPFLDNAVALTWLIWAHVGLALFFAVCASLAGWRVWRVKPDALLWMRRFWWAFLTWQGGFLLAFWWLNPFPNQWPVLVSSIIDTVLGFVIWRIYLQRSRRAANTFGPWHQVAYRDTTFLAELKGWLSPDSGKVADQADEVGKDAPAASVVVRPAEQETSGAVDTGQVVPAQKVAIPEPTARSEGSPMSLLGAYSLVAEEAKRGYFHEGLWLMCTTECGADEERATLLYNRKRAEMIQKGETA